MKRVINGKVYDTHTATIMGHICVRHGAPRLVWVYRKQTGEYFLANNYYMAARYEIEPVSENDARYLVGLQ